VSEATATNLLLGAALGMSAVGRVQVSDEDVERAAHFLANRSYEALEGRLDGEAVAARWTHRFHSGIPVCERCREVRDAAARCDGCGEALCLQCWGKGGALLCGVCWHRRQVAALTSGLEGHRVSIALANGSRIDDCELISSGHRGDDRLWLYSNGADTFIPLTDVTDVWESARVGSGQSR